MRNRLFVAASALVLVTGCGASGGSDGATTTTKAKAATTTEVAETTTTEPDEIEGAEEFQALVEGIDASIDSEAAARDEAAAENDLDTALLGISDLRDVLYEFDGDLRDLDVADDAVESINAVLEANGEYIAVLDDFNGITEIPEYNDTLDREAEVRDAWEEAVNDAAKELDVDGIEEGLAESGSTGGDDPAEPGGSGGPSDEEIIANREDNQGVEAGETITSTDASMTVPEGFTGTQEGPLTMSGPNGAQLGLYSVSGEEGEDLAAIAKDYVEGAADKNGYKITGGPEDTPVGDFEGVAYYYEYDDGRVAYDVFFEAPDSAGNQFHVLNLTASAEDAEELVAAVTEVLDTIQFE